ncbi:MAG: hypothetical protein AAGA30_06990 [Planctomycetota bacterium]
MNEASRLAVQRLSRFASQPEPEINQSYLVHEEHFCGIRFYAGPFVAQWLFREECIIFKRGDHVIDQISLDTAETSRRAA